MKYIGTYRDDKIIVFRGNGTNEWLKNWLSLFQGKVDRLLGTVDIQFTMKVWRPGNPSGPLEGSSATVEGIGILDTITINGKMAFPYFNINLSWGESNKLPFIHRKRGELVKKLNTDSHHYRKHKMAVLSGVEL